MTPKLAEQIIVMTGATSGLGRVACLSFANSGAKMVVLVRSMSKGKQLVNELKDFATPKKGSIDLIECDLADLNQVKNACDKIIENYDRIDCLINNAGIWNFSEIKSKDAIELTLQVNTLVPYYIIKRLTPLLEKSKIPKIITTASALHQGEVNFEDIEWTKGYSSFKAYRQSKLMVILLTRLLATQEEYKSMKLVTQHPGLVDTGLVRSGNWISRLFFKIFGISPEKGAETLIHLVEIEQDKLISGAYYASSREKKTSTAYSNNLNYAAKVEELTKKYLSMFL